jgi:hypothetical protein
MRFIQQLIAFLLLVVIVPLFLLAACNSALNAAVFNPQTYEEVFTDPLLFDDLLTVALPAFLQAGEEMAPEDFEFEGSPIRLGELSAQLDEETWREITTLLIPPDWLQARADQLLRALNELVNGDYSVLEESFELGIVQRRFQGEEAARAAALIVAEAPPCSREEAQRMETFVSSGEGTLPICSPTDEQLQERSILVLTQWFNAIGEGLENNAPTTAGFFDFDRDDARQLILLAEMNQQILLLMYICPAALLALVVVLAVRSLQGFSRWIGGSLLAIGVLMVVVLLFLQASVISAFGDILAPANEIEAFGARLLLPLLREGLAQASGELLIQSMIFVGLGFAVLAYAWLENRKQPEANTESGEYVLLTPDGRLVSSATQREIGTFTPSDMRKE